MKTFFSIKKFFSMSTKKQLISILVFQLSMLMIVYFMLINNNKGKHTDTATIMQDLLLTKISYFFSDTINSMDYISKYPIRQNSFYEYPLIYNILKKEKSSDNIHSIYMNTASDLSKLMKANKNISSIYIINNDGDGMIVDKDRHYTNINYNVDAYKNTLKLKGGLHIRQQDNNLLATRAIIDITDYEAIGYIGIIVETSDFFDEVNNSLPFKSTNFCVYNENKEFLWGNNNLDSFSSPKNYNDNEVIAYNKDDKVNTFLYSDGLYFIVTTDISEILNNFLKDNINLMFLCATILITAFILTLILLGKIIKPLNELVTVCKQIEHQKFNKINIPNGPLEIKNLSIVFNNMIDKIDHLINNVYSKELSLKKFEINLLKGQINSHFLYNTLDSIKMSAYSKGDNELVYAIDILSNLFKYATSKKTDLVTILEELNYIENYIKLQNFCYSNKIELVISCDKSLLDIKILKMLLQPIIENCILHAFSNTCNTPIIEIMIYKEDNFVNINISDNGIGLDAEKINFLNTLIQNENLENIGLNNVSRRIKIFYGNEFTLKIVSRINFGTSIRITILEG